MAEQRAAERLRPTQHEPDGGGEREEHGQVPRRDEAAVDHDDGPQAQAPQHHRLRARAFGDATEHERTEERDELDHQDRGGQHGELDVELLRRVRPRRIDDRPDATVVEQEGDEELQGLRIVAELAHRAAELAERGDDRVPVGLDGTQRRPVLERAQRDDGEERPPHARGAEADPDRQLGRQTARRVQVEDEVEREQQPATDVAQGPATRGDTVAVVSVSDLGQERVVDDDRSAERDVGEQDEEEAELPAAGDDQEHRHREAGTGVRGAREPCALALGAVGERADDREDDDLQERGQAEREEEQLLGCDAEAQQRHGAVRTDGRSSDLDEVGPEEDGPDGRGERGVRPVVDVPASLLSGVTPPRALHRCLSHTRPPVRERTIVAPVVTRPSGR